VNAIPPIRTTSPRAMPLDRLTPARGVRVGAALVGVAGILVLAGCSAAASETAESEVVSDTSNDSSSSDTSGSSGSSSSTDSSSGTTTTTSTYKDGTYTATGAYTTPESTETLTVTVTLKDDVITAVSVTGTQKAAETKQYQSAFVGGISSVVVGKDIDKISVSRVAGSSLTSSGFNKAISTIKTQAKA